MKFICKIDNSEFNSLEELIAYLKRFKISQKDYFTTYYERKDLLTGELIPFKSSEQYYFANFLNKNNAKKWFKENPDKAKEFALDLLKQRIAHKKLTQLPTEVELQSCGLPNSNYLYNFIGKSKIELEVGLTNKYEYPSIAPIFTITKDTIVVDTREQAELNFGKRSILKEKLDFGDYALQGMEKKIVIERKSLPDLIASFVTNIERVKKEFERAKESGAYLYVVCEESLNTAMNYIHIPYLRKYTKIPPEVLFYNIRDMLHNFDCQFVFCDGRKHATTITEYILDSKESGIKYDWQYLINHLKL